MVTDPASLGSIAEYEQAIAAHPDELSYYWRLGLLYWLADDLEGAQSVWLSGLMATDSSEAALRDLLNLLQAEADQQLASRPDRAEQLYQIILEMQPDQADMYGRLGWAVARQGRLEDAIEWWQQAIEQNPTWADPSRWQGQVWQRLEQYEAAAVAYQQALARQADPQVYADLGICLIYLQRWQAAIRALQAALALQSNSSATLDLGWVWFWLQQAGLAWACFRSGLQQSRFAETYGSWVNEPHQQRSEDLMLNAAWLQQVMQPDETEASMRQLRELVAQRFPSVKEEVHSHPDDSHLTAAFYPTTQDWATDSGQWIALDPAHDFSLTPPQTLDNNLHFSFCFERTIRLPGTFVAEIPQGRVWLADDQSSTAVWTGDYQLLGDVSVEFPLLSPGHADRQPGCHSALSRSLPTVQWVAGRVAVLAGLTDTMYFHWMFDVLPRIDVLQRSGQFTTIDWFLVSNHLPFQQQTLVALGVPPERILAVEGEMHLQADQLIVPSFPAVPAWMPNWACQFLRGRFLPDLASCTATSSKRLRLYLSRQQTAHRRIINQTDLQPILDRFGFQTVQLELLSIQEQASLMARAEAVLAPHGSGLTNLVFCQPGTKVIELFSPNFVYPCYWLVSNQVGLTYYYLTGTTPAGHFLQRVLYPNPRLEDLWIDPVQLATLLQQVFE
jgi:tetratricopeptide (TPR) repeat protein